MLPDTSDQAIYINKTYDPHTIQYSHKHQISQHKTIKHDNVKYTKPSDIVSHKTNTNTSRQTECAQIPIPLINTSRPIEDAPNPTINSVAADPNMIII